MKTIKTIKNMKTTTTTTYTTFEEFLNESPLHIAGDAPFEDDELNDRIGDVSKQGIEKNYKLINKNFTKGLSLYKHNNGTYYVVGLWYNDNEETRPNKERFAIITNLSFKPTTISSKQKQINGKEAIKINIIHTTKEWRYQGISTKLYKYILKQGYCIISDSIQYDGAVELWKKFVTVPNTTIRVYDINKDKIISKFTEKTPYPSVWSKGNNSKMNTRLVFCDN